MSFRRRIFTKAFGAPLTDALADFHARWQREWRLIRIHHRGCTKAAAISLSRPLRLHLGCGNTYKQDWINIDTYYTPPCIPDLTLDLRRRLPFPDNSCTIIYSEHFFEHLSYPQEASAFLLESLRLLIPGGKLSIGVPDPRPVLNAYLDDSHDPYFDYFFAHFSVHRHLNTKMEAVNWLFKQGGEHQFIYDFPSLKLMLEQATFSHVSQREFDPALDSESRQHGTIYVDAYKPG